ncbi:tetratricopeptide repeat protein [Bizionia sediminis]|uniref:Tetratricopeptide repeat protein n=1 Tax=Bizionia sediminis TaxID=1737064 RepID=A0ABW5KSS8_9FLAO
MKKLLVAALCTVAFLGQAQTNTHLLDHYRAYYKQMKVQGDSDGIINGLTHLVVLAPKQAQAYKDTLAMVYMSEGKHVQALNTIGIEPNTSDSDIAVEVKAISLKAINETNRALVHFEELFARTPDPSIAYELAELYLQTGNLENANTYITYGLENVKPAMGKMYYESQQPYQVALKSGFLYLKALATFNENKATNINAAIAILEDAIQQSPNFNLAKLSKNALLNQQQEQKTPKE